MLQIPLLHNVTNEAYKKVCCCKSIKSHDSIHAFQSDEDQNWGTTSDYIFELNAEASSIW